MFREKLEYAPLEKPIYWIGLQDNKIVRRKFTKYQVKYPRYLKEESNTPARYFSIDIEKNKMDQLLTVGNYSMYSYNFIDEEKFLQSVADFQLKRIEYCDKILKEQKELWHKLEKMLEELRK